MKYYLGIDGGGTKTEFLLTDEQGNVISHKIKLGTNPNDIGVESSVELLSNGINEVLSAQAIDVSDLFIFAGVAGCGVGENAAMLRRELRKEFQHVEVETDLVNALEICLQGEDGLAVICGTGISCCICENGERKIIGGYGYLFEEGGSGYAYGRDAVIAALKYEDGIGEETVLLNLFKKYFGKSLRHSLGELLLKGKFFVASFSPLVFEGYELGDGVCKKILENNFNHTIELIRNALSLRSKETTNIAFIGGVSKLAIFENKMKESLKGYNLIFCDVPPVFGAVKKAVKLSKTIK